ncbi:MAG: hypothetical protein Q9163_003797 [Psora crenata]
MFNPTAVEGRQEMPLGFQESIFNSHLVDVWQGLLRSEMTEKWRGASGEIIRGVAFHYFGGYQDMLRNSSEGFDLQPGGELEGLPSTDTDDAGVYARLVSSRYGIQKVSDRYLYVGCASRYGSGLIARISEHTVKRKRSDESRLQRDIRKKDLKGNNRFVTLMVMRMDSPKSEDVHDVRLTVTLAEAISAMWLGALQSPSLHLQNLCQWDPQTLEYTAWSSHNPLTVEVVKPSRSKESTIETHCG